MGRDMNSGGDSMRQLLNRLWREESGQDATEYVLLVVLIALAITAGMTVLATGINGAFRARLGGLDLLVDLRTPGGPAGKVRPVGCPIIHRGR